MSRFLKALAKVGLVELDDSERNAEAHAPPLAESAASDVALDAQSTSPPAAPPVDLAEIARPLADLYAAAQVPTSPFPAEKLVRILDGLRAMDPALRKAAVLAMDAADEDWAVEDAVRDARTKVAALEQARQALTAAVAQAEAQAEQDTVAQESYQQEATASIRKQIADLEGLLERELAKVAQERAAIQARLQQTKESAAREAERLAHEIRNLEEVGAMFSTAGEAAKTQS